MRSFVSIAKYPDQEYANEDAVGGKTGEYIIISDGAGGGGVYADKWASYLVEHISPTPICSFAEMDGWIDGIWEEFYKKYEEEAKKKGGLFLTKFYDEGSFATIAAAWMTDENTCHWATYGDSVIFCYHKSDGRLECSFKKLVDFNNPPYLINFTNELKEEGFRYGSFELEKDSIVFAASDTLSHYIIMMYEISKREEFGEDLQTAIDAHSKNSNAIKTAMALGQFDFERDVLNKLFDFVGDKSSFQKHIDSLRRKGLLMEDDYSLVLMNPYISEEKSCHISLKDFCRNIFKKSSRKSLRKYRKKLQ